MTAGISRPILDRAFLKTRSELRGLAQVLMRSERNGHTLQPTAVVHETYLRLLRSPPRRIRDTAHFLSLAGTTLRRVLVDHARGRRTIRRGGDRDRADLVDADAVQEEVAMMTAVAEAISSLAREDPRGARVAELRLFGGLSIDEIAAQVGVSTPTIERDWRFGRAWIERRMQGDRDGSPGRDGGATS